MHCIPFSVGRTVTSCLFPWKICVEREKLVLSCLAGCGLGRFDLGVWSQRCLNSTRVACDTKILLAFHFSWQGVKFIFRGTRSIWLACLCCNMNSQSLSALHHRICSAHYTKHCSYHDDEPWTSYLRRFCVPEVAPRILLEAFYVTSIWSGTFHCIAEHYCPSTT